MASKDQPFLFLLPIDWPKLTRLAAFLLGGLTTLLFAPMELSLLAPVAVLPLLFLALVLSPRDAAAYYFYYGFGLFLSGTYWIYISVHVFGNAPLWIAVILMIGLSLIMAAFVAVAGWLASRLSHGEPLRLLLVGPAAWVVVEWLRGWVLSGFPWLALGYSQIDLPLAGWAPVLGVYGVSLMLAISIAAIIPAVMSVGKMRWIAIAAIILPWLVGGALTSVEWTQPYGDPIRTTIVQGGIAQDKKWLAEQRQPTLEFYADSTRDAEDSALVVWPEVAIPALQDQVPIFITTVERDARRLGQTVVFGVLERDYRRSETGQVFNSVLAVGNGERQSYRKRHLVPFGEYFPVPAAVREWMRLRNLPHADLAAGSAVQPLIVAGDDTEIAVAICYEDAYGAEQLYALPDAGLLVNVSNDAWFGDSIAPHQHLQIARMRALEVGRYSVRATNTGISAFIGPDGSVLERGRQFVPEVMTREVRVHRGSTPYVGIGNWGAMGLSFAILGIFWLRSRTGL